MDRSRWRSIAICRTEGSTSSSTAGSIWTNPRGNITSSCAVQAGKTTLGLNLAASLISGEEFLDWFEVEQLVGNVGYWNLEVDQSQMFDWQKLIIPRNTDKMFTAHLRGKRI